MQTKIAKHFIKNLLIPAEVKIVSLGKSTYFACKVICMIQRKQSLFLLIAGLISLMLMYLPVYELIPDLSASQSGPQETIIYKITENSMLTILNVGIGALSIFCILLYKKRNLQIRLCNLLLLLTCGLIGLLFFSADSISTTMGRKLHYVYGSYLPIFQILFLFLAMRYVKKDEELVRSADRLR